MDGKPGHVSDVMVETITAAALRIGDELLDGLAVRPCDSGGCSPQQHLGQELRHAAVMRA